MDWANGQVVAAAATVVNFINILQAAFVPLFFCQKITKPNCNKRKAACKILMKLTPGLATVAVLAQIGIIKIWSVPQVKCRWNFCTINLS